MIGFNYDVENRNTEPGIPYFMLKTTGFNKKYIKENSMPKTIDNFVDLPDYLLWWDNSDFWVDTFTWFEEAAGLNSSFLLFDFADYASTTAEKIKAMQYFYKQEQYNWIKDDASTVTYDAERVNTMESFIYRISDPAVGLKFTSLCPAHTRIDIGTIVGNTTIGGTLQVDNITGNNGMVQLESANVKNLYVNGTSVIPNVTSTRCEMDLKTVYATLYKNKCLDGIPDDAMDEFKTDPTDPTKIHCGQVVCDINYCGKVYFCNIRTILLDNLLVGIGSTQKMYTLYAPATDKSTGFGRFSIGYEINPYGFEIDHGKVEIGASAAKEQVEKVSGISYLVSGTPTSILIPNANNKYILASRPYKIISKLTNNAGSVYYVKGGGKVTFYITELGTKYINLEWAKGNDIPMPTTYSSNTDSYTEELDFIMIDGFSFVAVGKNDNDGTNNYYKGIKWTN